MPTTRHKADAFCSKLDVFLTNTATDLNIHPEDIDLQVDISVNTAVSYVFNSKE